MPYLLSLGTGRRYDLPKKEIAYLGLCSNGRVVFNNIYKPIHAHISPRFGGRWHTLMTRSKQVRINDRSVPCKVMMNGDSIKIGEVVFVFIRE